MTEKYNCERRVSGVLNRGQRSMRMHKTNAEGSSSHRDIWWYGTSFDDGYLYRSEPHNQGVAPFSIIDKNSEIDLD
ncbi:hypothetical protein GGQ84_000445 [Desulfitispora alkaliphila]|uniref:hypothetical protein n=1 Tax=Desulfitispora alkaliphila TaxID=622674 RepID=UPI003D24A262